MPLAPAPVVVRGVRGRTRPPPPIAESHAHAGADASESPARFVLGSPGSLSAFRSPSHDSRPPKRDPRAQAFSDRSLSVILFKNVTNADDVHRALLDRSLQPEMALVDPAPTHSLFALHAAAHKAVVDDARGVLTTRTVHSELVYNLSANKHITEGLRRFGMADDASAVLACRFDATDADVAAMANVIAGDAVPAGDLEAELSSLGDPARVKKYYKHGDLECKQGVGTVEDAIVQRIGTRDVL